MKSLIMSKRDMREYKVRLTSGEHAGKDLRVCVLRRAMVSSLRDLLDVAVDGPAE